MALVVLLEVEAGRFPEDSLERHAAGLSRRDRALAAALVHGVLRWQSRLEWTIAHFLTKPGRRLDQAVRLILAQALFQIQFLDRIPASAAVSEAVSLAKIYGPPWASGLVNAVLRSLTRATSLPDPLTSSRPRIERLALAEAHPVWLVERWVREMEWDRATALLAANNQPAPLTLHVNSERTTRERVAEVLGDAVARVEPTALTPDGLRLWGSTGPVAELPGFAQGYFTVQDEAATLAALMARPGPGGLVLDACAGQGGKSLTLATGGIRVLAMDTDRGRLERLAAEEKRLGLDLEGRAVGNLASPPWPEARFDVVLVDAPCSSLGVIRRRPDVKWAKNAADPARLAAGQGLLLSAAAPLVRPGGRLVYAVCTSTTEETDGVIRDFLARHPEFRIQPADELLPASARPALDTAGFLRTWPHLHGTDGFFAAAMRKTTWPFGTTSK